ncbi:hypothetical protein SD71_21125 [Cohnella kolymensis]|uniref:Conjugal transfer protein TraX n=2 Tax=Cohnella kolymensis TaxID=1590652 RepID=A0ABR4ZZM6_9BACL|nr:hypothetical protein SD71_21125 [Cohnella kolymensis]
MQLIAMVTMLIDHIGFIFSPHTDILRIIGRIAFPLYSWFLVQGYLHTRNHKKYMMRLLALACISQVPYTLALQRFELNVIFTLLLSLLALYAASRIASGTLRAAALGSIIAAAILVPMDYGIYGILLTFIYRYLRDWQMVAGHLLLNAAFFLASGGSQWLQLFSVLGTVIIVNPVPYRGTFFNKWVYRSFYPAHLLLLFGVSVLLERF